MMRFSRSAVLAVAVIFAVGCGGGEQAGEMRAASPRAIVQAFDRAGLEAVDKGPIAPNEFGVAPRLTEKTRRFLIPSLGGDSGGRVFVFENSEDLERTKKVYDTLGRESGLLFSWTFANEARGVLVQINGDLPKAKAARYQAVVARL